MFNIFLFYYNIIKYYVYIFFFKQERKNFRIILQIIGLIIFNDYH